MSAARAAGARAPLVALALVSLACASCAGHAEEDLPPHGEAVVFVDTDLAVPSLASRLRVDLYDETGRWFESRDIGRSEPRDWPTSFSVFSNDDANEKRVLVRLRVYPEGAVRDYLGERYAAKTPYVEPRVSATEAEMCASAPELPLGERVTLREGATPITQHLVGPTCPKPAVGGSVAARVRITTPGVYTFAVANVVPFIGHTTLSLRARCDDASTQLACRSGSLDFSAIQTAGHFPRFNATLEPGTYWLVTTGMAVDQPQDVTLEVLPVDLPLPAAAPASSPDVAAPSDPAPRLRRLGDTGSFDPTPASEPVPTTTIDRLLLLRLVPGRRDRVHVVLRGSCAGTMARLGADPKLADPKSAATCIDASHTWESLDEERPLPSGTTAPSTTEQGTFARGEPCRPSESTAERVCVPGGVFVLGSRLQFEDVSTIRKTTPEHIAAMSRFWMDRNEYTVARYRAALASGFVPDETAIVANEGPIAPDPAQLSAVPLCTWSASPRGREDYPLNCIRWSLARKLCQADGGDLPTEAQWEYAATAAGRPFETTYPWGDDDAPCRAVGLDRRASAACRDVNGGAEADVPLSTHAADGSDGRPGDLNPLGIANLAGNVAELTRDSAQQRDRGCWLGASVNDPVCDEANAPNRIAKGGAWASAATPTFIRFFFPSGFGGSDARGVFQPSPELGFRCVYGGPR